MTPAEHPDAPAPVRRGRWFDDFHPGDEIVSGARTVTEADVGAFAGLSGDFNPLHVDQTFAARTPFRGRVAHGFLVDALSSGLAAQTGVFDGTIAALERTVSHYQRPVRAGDTLHMRLVVVEVDPSPSRSRGRVRFATSVYNQDGQRALEGEWVTLLLRDRSRRPESGAGQAVAQESAP